MHAALESSSSGRHAATAAQSRYDLPLPAAGRPLNVLLVEDNDLDVLSLQRAFNRSRKPHRLRTVSRVADALASLRDGSDDGQRRLVLLDLNLPEQSGHDFLRQVRDDPALTGLPVVVLTGSAVESDRLRAFERHVAGYMLKPVDLRDFDDLVAALHQYWSLSEFPP